MAEINGTGKQLNKSGWYKSRESGVEVFVEETPGIGSPMIDAFIQAGYDRIDQPTLPTPDVVSEYTESTTKSGAVQYRHNGKLISKNEYENNI